jgi:octaprenyl-diphosphate synthase
MYQMDKRCDCDITEDEYIDLIRHKTASLFSCSCEAGAIIGGLPAKARKNLIAYGDDLGVAFQIVDDMLDFVGDVERMGKPVGNDFRDGRVTLPLIAALREAGTGDAGGVRSSVCGTDFTEDMWEEVLEFVKGHGGIEYSRRLCARLVDSAKDRLEDIPECPARKSLAVLADYVIARQK